MINFQCKYEEYLISFTLWRKEELHNLHSSPDIIRQVNSRRMRWAGHVARIGEYKKVYKVLVWKPEGKRPLGRPRRKWEDGIRMHLREIGLGVWFGFYWLRAGTDGGLLWVRWWTSGFLRHGVSYEGSQCNNNPKHMVQAQSWWLDRRQREHGYMITTVSVISLPTNWFGHRLKQHWSKWVWNRSCEKYAGTIIGAGLFFVASDNQAMMCTVIWNTFRY
jgi:hypothetical protein